MQHLSVRVLARSAASIRAFVESWDGVGPEPRRRSPWHLSLIEREEMSRGVAAGESMRCIAVRLGRAPSTVSRELARNGARSGYRGLVIVGRTGLDGSDDPLSRGPIGLSCPVASPLSIGSSMLALWTKVTSWMQEEKGASMVEYSLLVVLIAIVALVAVQLAGTEVSETFSEIGSSLD